MYLYKQFLKMYISTLLVSPKLLGFILEQHPTYSPFSWLSESRRNIKTRLCTFPDFYTPKPSQFEKEQIRLQKISIRKLMANLPFFPFIVIPLFKCLWHQTSTNTTHNQFYPAEKTHFQLVLDKKIHVFIQVVFRNVHLNGTRIS